MIIVLNQYLNFSLELINSRPLLPAYLYTNRKIHLSAFASGVNEMLALEVFTKETFLRLITEDFY